MVTLYFILNHYFNFLCQPSRNSCVQLCLITALRKSVTKEINPWRYLRQKPIQEESHPDCWLASSRVGKDHTEQKKAIVSLLAWDCGLHFPLLHHKEVCSLFTSLFSFQAFSQDYRSCPEVTHSVCYLSVNLNVIIFSLLQLRKTVMHKGLTHTFGYHRKQASPSSVQTASHGRERHCKRGVLGGKCTFYWDVSSV